MDEKVNELFVNKCIIRDIDLNIVGLLRLTQPAYLNYLILNLI
jgi:hypothetical protein